MSRPYLFLLMPVLSDLVFAIQFHLPVNSVKCLQEDVDKNVLVAGEYELSEEPRTTTNLKVRECVAPVTYGKTFLSPRKQNSIILFLFLMSRLIQGILSHCVINTHSCPRIVFIFFFMGKMDKNLIKGFYFVGEIEKQSNM